MRDAVSEVFAALADPTRRQLYERLLADPLGRTATELVATADVSRQAIVKHLQVLGGAGLATAHREGREVRYFVSATGTLEASAWLTTKASEWDRRLAKLAATVDAGSSTRPPKRSRSRN